MRETSLYVSARTAVLWLAASLAGCGGDADKPVNIPPDAHLEARSPSVRTGDPAIFDASMSTDRDGVIVLYRFVFPDDRGETASTAPIVAHRFTKGGSQEVEVIVVDNGGGEGRATARVTVLPQPIPACKSNADCRDGELCAAGECHAHPCSAARPCAPPLSCMGGECLPPGPSTRCRSDADCPALRLCASGNCVCKTPLRDCSGTCVDVRTSTAHCGICGNSCGAGSCTDGTCSGKPVCSRDADCSSDKRCLGGQCVCPSGRTKCGDVCVDLAGDAKNCGACGKLCAAGEACTFGTCIPKPACAKDGDCTGGRFCTAGTCACPADQMLCGGICRTVASDGAHCGGCFLPCSPTQICADGRCVASGKCTDAGECATLESCTAGFCTCPAPATDCGAAGCVDARSDPANCGACGAKCGAGAHCADTVCIGVAACPDGTGCEAPRGCSGGVCVCPAGTTDCGSACADLLSDEGHCGACGRTCSEGFVCEAARCRKASRGTILTTVPSPTGDDAPTGLDFVGGSSFWATGVSGVTYEFDLMGDIFFKLMNPDDTDERRPFGVSTDGTRLFAGFYLKADGTPIASDLIRYTALGGIEMQAGSAAGGATAWTPSGLYVLRHPEQDLLLVDPDSFAVLSSTPVVGLDPAETSFDIAFDGKTFWTAGYNRTTSAASLRLIDPLTGAVVESLPPPDSYLGGVAYDGAFVWVAGEKTLFKMVP